MKRSEKIRRKHESHPRAAHLGPCIAPGPLAAPPASASCVGEEAKSEKKRIRKKKIRRIRKREG
jgi:hypothetical protein